MPHSLLTAVISALAAPLGMCIPHTVPVALVIIRERDQTGAVPSILVLHQSGLW